MTEQIMTDRERTALQLSRARYALEKVWPMVESKHTPGPWEWVKRTYYHDLVGANGVVVCSDGSAAGEYGPDIDVTGPDARLIAAAPDLLAACKRALHLVEDEDNNKLIVEMPGSFGLLLDLQNAIEKATGEKP